MLREIFKKSFWYVSLVFVLVVLVWGLTVMTKRIDYIWYWNRIPQYFFFTDQIEKFASESGKISINGVEDDLTEVTLHYDDGTKETFEVETESLTFKEGDRFTDVDKIGELEVFSQGILIIGLITTLEISLYSSVLGLLIGLFAGLSRISKNPLIKGLSTIYVEIIRGTPLLVQLFIFYFFLGTVLGFGRFAAGTLALSFFAGAYVAEIIRAGIQSIHAGQMEAARSLGMNYLQTMTYIILPQAFKRTMPPLAGQFISLIKDSSLVSVIAITDLTKAAREISTSTFATFEVFFTISVMYLVLTFSLSMLVRYIERRFAVSD